MIKSEPIEIYSRIRSYLPDVDTKTIDINLYQGRMIDGKFVPLVPGERGLITLQIKNIPDISENQVDVDLPVDASGQVTLTKMPLEGNDILIDDVPIHHSSGQLVICNGKVEGDFVKASYYHTEPGYDWFDAAGSFIQSSNPDYVGMDDYTYNKTRLFGILKAMGLIDGEVV